MPPNDDGCEFEQVLGIRFLNAPVQRALELLHQGGLMVVPAAPALATLPDDASYRDAVEHADFALVDSSYLAVLWLVLARTRLERVSGLAFLRAFLGSPSARDAGGLFLINPSDVERDANLRLLRAHGFAVSEDDCYTAPVYQRGAIEDAHLVERLEHRRPRYIMINLGGGTQEPLGLYLRSHLTYLPAILCTGAAISFLTGQQTAISPLVDRLGLGWLWRSMGAPRRFVPRYLSSVKLATLVRSYGTRSTKHTAQGRNESRGDISGSR